jgi:hypothetical protein
VIDKAFMDEAFHESRNMTKKELSAKIGVDRGTLSFYMKKFGVSKTYSDITDQELDELIRGYKQHHPGSGIRYVIGYLRGKQMRVQVARITKSVKRVDELGVILRKKHRIRRRVYSVKRPNSLWHCDGHHKLINWGIVIHGFIDGYSRLVSLWIESIICN